MQQERLADDIRALTSERVDEYRRKYEDPLPVTLEGTYGGLRHGEKGTSEDVEDYFEELTGFYDELLEVDSTPFREKFRDGIRYDTSFREVAEDSVDLLGASNGAVGASLTAGGLFLLGYDPGLAVTAGAFTGSLGSLLQTRFMHDGSYNSYRGTIGVGRKPEEKPELFYKLSKELYHAYQANFDSETYGDMFLEEGSEQAISVHAFSELKDWEKEVDTLELNTFISGHYRFEELLGNDPGKENLEELGLRTDEVESFLNDRDRHIDETYHVGASAILTEENMRSTEVFREVFHGESDIPGTLEGLENRTTRSGRFIHRTSPYFPFR